MFKLIGSLAIATAVGAIIGAGVALAIGSESHEESYSHMLLETSHLGEMRHGLSINYVGDGSYCETVSNSLGNSVTIRVPNAIPTYNLLTNPATIIECETRE